VLILSGVTCIVNLWTLVFHLCKLGGLVNLVYSVIVFKLFL
jgi:hypothetical protein